MQQTFVRIGESDSVYKTAGYSSISENHSLIDEKCALYFHATYPAGSIDPAGGIILLILLEENDLMVDDLSCQ